MSKLNLSKVKEIMEELEKYSVNGFYEEFEAALLITERSTFNSKEITQEMVDRVIIVSQSYDTLFNQDLDYDLDNIFGEYEFLNQFENNEEEL